ncbi:alpha/beta hydrolase [Streptomyces fildesensis]|uniref:Alpha/beta hydrolase n=1 Tax=Streptomyces fildesensis TaxID=375757 RepID=A0ABW8CC40_9ACTN
MGTSTYPALGFDPCPGDPEGVTTLAGKWLDAAFVLTEVALRLDRTDEAQARWQGQAATTFRTELGANRDTIGKMRAAYEHNAGLLNQWAGQLREFQQQADALETQAAAIEAKRRSETAPHANPMLALRVPPTAPAKPSDLDQLQAGLSGLKTQAGQLNELYLDAARVLARGVSGLLALPSGTTGWYGQNIDSAEESLLIRQETHRKGGPVPIDPALRATWWNGLTPEEQAAMVRDHPDVVGSANGLPAAARNAANMLLLKKYRDEAEVAGGDRYNALNELYKSLTDPTDPGYRRPSFLLGIDQNGAQGHAIVCYGNPDTALNTAVYVPGTGSSLNHVNGDAGRARTMFDEANKSDPGSTASMVWLGYDAPQDVTTDSPFQSWADNGSPLLADYVNSLALTHQGASHVTVIGHSYGSTVVGESAAKHGMHADDIVVVGSPGLTVDHASDLHMDPHHVWAGKMANDVVIPLSAPLDPSKWGNDHSARFGTDPTSSDFGGRTFASGYGEPRPDKSHSDYWHDDQPSLANMTRVVTGHPQDVTAPSTAERDGNFPTGSVGPGNNFQIIGGVQQAIGHSVPDGYGDPLTHAGQAYSQAGHGINAATGAGTDLLSGDLEGAKHQAGDIVDDVGGAVKDVGNAIIDPFTGW